MRKRNSNEKFYSYDLFVIIFIKNLNINRIKARIKMFGDENIDDEDFLLSSPKILVNT
jgi:hypothetical protein